MSNIISIADKKELLVDYNNIPFSDLLDQVMNYQKSFDSDDSPSKDEIMDGILLFQSVRNRTINEELKDFCNTYLKHLHLILNSIQLEKGNLI
jgi:hypothetical protein